MTTRCCRRTPNCRGIAYEPGGQSERREIEAAAGATARMFKQIIRAALECQEACLNTMPSSCQDPEAGS